jgi:hypothetical protein
MRLYSKSIVIFLQVKINLPFNSAMKRTICLLAILLLFLSVNAQYSRELNFRNIIVPHTNCFAQKGDLKLILTRQAFFPSVSYVQGSFSDKFEPWVVNMFGNFGISNERRIALSYAMNSNIVFGVNYLRLVRRDGTFIILNDWNINFYEDTYSFDFSGAYHNALANNFEYEVGTSLMFGTGGFTFWEVISYDLMNEDSNLDYSTFNHNFLGSISYRYKKLQLTAQLNTGYVRYYNTSYSPVLPGAYANIVSKFYSHQTDYYIDPAFIININFRRFGMQVHFSRPYAFGENKITKVITNLGLGVSYKILRGKGE